MTLRVDVSQNRYKEGGRLPLGNQLPTAGLTELQRKVEEVRKVVEESRGTSWNKMVMEEMRGEKKD